MMNFKRYLKEMGGAPSCLALDWARFFVSGFCFLFSGPEMSSAPSLSCSAYHCFSERTQGQEMDRRRIGNVSVFMVAVKSDIPLL